MSEFDQFAFSARPHFDEAATRAAFAKAVPLKTLVIYCYDPRAAEVPNAVAKWLGEEEYPGRVIVDENGKRVASTTTLFPSSLPADALSTLCDPSLSPSTCSACRTSLSSTTPSAARRRLPRTASSKPSGTSIRPTSAGSTTAGASVLRTMKHL